jgi:biopolymer transport protein ExbD
MGLKTGFEDQRARIEMIPLMDVVFLLLVFFIYAMFSMTVHRGLQVDLPRAAGAREIGQQLIVTIRADNQLMLGDREGTVDDIVLGAVQGWRAAHTPVLISADRAASIGTGIELLAKLRRAGVEAVAFQVRPVESER